MEGSQAPALPLNWWSLLWLPWSLGSPHLRETKVSYLHSPLPGLSPAIFLGLSRPSMHPLCPCPSQGPSTAILPIPEAFASAQALLPHLQKA